jgi:hypothetical protein
MPAEAAIAFVLETEQASHVADVLNVLRLIESILCFEIGLDFRG